MEELTQFRTPKSKLFDLGHGVYRREVGAVAYAYKNGLWVPVDSTIDTSNGSDADTGLAYKAVTRPSVSDFNMRFGVAPPWFGIAHAPSNKKIVFKPRASNTNLTFEVVDNKITLRQVWTGIDLEIIVHDKGIKSNYIITSGAGQRIIEFDVEGDIAQFKLARPVYPKPDNTAPFGHPQYKYTQPPADISNGVLTYDFRQVPIGTVVDPSVGPIDADTGDVTTRHHPLVTSWATTIAAAAANDQLDDGGSPTFSLGTYNDFNAGSPYCARGFIQFDVSSIPAGSTVTAATLNVWVMGSVLGDAGSGLKCCLSDWDTPGTLATYGHIGAAASADIYRIAATNPALFTLNDFTSITPGGLARFSMRNNHDLAGAQPVSFSLFNFYSADYSNSPDRPRLTVDYTPGAGATAVSIPFPFSRNPRNNFKWR